MLPPLFYYLQLLNSPEMQYSHADDTGEQWILTFLRELNIKAYSQTPDLERLTH